MYKMMIDAESGRPTAFYNTNIHDNIPEEAIEITDNAWEYCQQHSGKVRWDGSAIVLIPDEPPPPSQAYVVPFVSDRQFIQALAEKPYELITWDEAEAWGARGELPKLATDGLEQIEDEDLKKRARYFLKTAKQFDRKHWATDLLGALLKWESSQLDDLWNFADTL